MTTGTADFCAATGSHQASPIELHEDFGAGLSALKGLARTTIIVNPLLDHYWHTQVIHRRTRQVDCAQTVFGAPSQAPATTFNWLISSPFRE